MALRASPKDEDGHHHPLIRSSMWVPNTSPAKNSCPLLSADKTLCVGSRKLLKQIPTVTVTLDPNIFWTKFCFTFLTQKVFGAKHILYQIFFGYNSFCLNFLGPHFFNQKYFRLNLLIKRFFGSKMFWS